MSTKFDTLYPTTKVSLRRLVVIGALSGAAVIGGVTIASASTAHQSKSELHPFHSLKGLNGFGGLRGPRPVVDGKVTAVGTGSFTVLDRSSTSYTVSVTGTTTYKEHNVSSVGVGDVQVGTFVDIVGSVSGTSVTATEVRIETGEPTVVPSHSMGIRPDARGRVTALGTSSFTITNWAGKSLIVDTTDATTFEARGITSPSLADIKVGDFAAVRGTITGTTVAATNVHFGDGHPFRGPNGSPDFGRVSGLSRAPLSAPGM
ncbi:MAG TPA: DUF5666 domain-containing protein [Acidimicrobiales bacterium]|nr:DUF5666 domain-containing protein [Acidimicrobiales bacterium]